METNCEYISFESTGYFSKMMIDYVKGDEKLKPFYKYPVSIEGIKASIEARRQFNTPRLLLQQELRNQYKNLSLTEKQGQNLSLLTDDNTFTLCTAHQPNIFTGPLYFIYKILHTIGLADYLNEEIPGCQFVPVYYMGSEDADLDELGHINLSGEKLEWQTTQTGAVGRMKVDKQLLQLLDRIADEIEVSEHGKTLIKIFREAYQPGELIQQATLRLVNELFKDFGLLTVIPDNANLKREFSSVVKKELVEQFSYSILQETCNLLSKEYKAQASGREINLFYLTETKRERIERAGEKFQVEELGLSWSKEEILSEVEQHPERFSANVILRGLFQETVLPNIAFIGGGGEIAYWLELKEVFNACNIPYPVLIIRNSFLLLEKKHLQLVDKLGLQRLDLFKPVNEIINQLVQRDSQLQLDLHKEKEQLASLYNKVRQITEKIDPTLSTHTKALETQAMNKILVLEKKMLRAEKRKFDAEQRQVNSLKNLLFPSNSLQERQDNFAPFYALHGQSLLTELYKATTNLQQEFCLFEIEE